MTVAARAPERAEGVELLGALAGAGYRDAPQLVRRADGQTLQLTPLLYELLELVDGQRDAEGLARELSASSGRTVSAADVAFLLEDKLAPLGVLNGREAAEGATSNPLLALRFKVVASSPTTTRRLTAPFAVLFTPLVLWTVLAAFVGVCWFVLVEKGLASATRQAFDTPGLLLAVFALSVLSAGFHELGHAAACRYGGATPGVMGMGLYVVWPAFYTNVDDSYRLDRRGRLRVDLGGLYFNAVVAVVVLGLWFGTGIDALLLGVATQLLQMLRQLAPVLRADGYHILADLTGVPDLFAHLLPTVKRLLPSYWGTPSPLTRKARIIVTAWVLVVVPVLVAMMLTAVLLLPRLIATAWTSGGHQVDRLGDAAGRADFLTIGAASLQLLALLLPVAGISYMVVRTVKSALSGTWRVTDGRPFLRGLAMGVVTVLLAVLFWAWWPVGQYTPVRADERGTLPSLVQHHDRVPLRAATAVPLRQTALAMVPRGGATEAHPALLLLRGADGLRAVLTSGENVPARSLPFSLPAAPGPGDNQAVAVNTKDGSTVYDVAVVLVTVTDGADVTSENKAYALASCTACTTVSVAFQVVLVVGQSDVIVPVNAAVAGNRACVQCVTSALAVQLVVTLRSAPPADVQAGIEAAMSQLDDLEGLAPADVYAQVTAVQSQVLTALTEAGLVTATEATTAGAGPTPSATAAAASVSASPSATATATSAPSATTSPTTAPEPSQTPTPEPTATAGTPPP